MTWVPNADNPYIVGQPTSKSILQAGFLNTIVLAELLPNSFFGGVFNEIKSSTGWDDLTGSIINEIDGSSFTGLDLQLWFTAYVTTGQGRVRLWNESDAVAVGSSETLITDTTPTLKKSANLAALPSAAKEFRAQWQIDTAGDNLRVWGVRLVIVNP